MTTTASEKRFVCPKCGGPLYFEAWEPVHYLLNPQTGAISKKWRRDGEALDSHPGLVCQNGECGWVLVDDVSVDHIERKVLSFEP